MCVMQTSGLLCSRINFFRVRGLFSRSEPKVARFLENRNSELLGVFTEALQVFTTPYRI